jgi:hypothetical protein
MIIIPLHSHPNPHPRPHSHPYSHKFTACPHCRTSVTTPCRDIMTVNTQHTLSSSLQLPSSLIHSLKVSYHIIQYHIFTLSICISARPLLLSTILDLPGQFNCHGTAAELRSGVNYMADDGYIFSFITSSSFYACQTVSLTDALTLLAILLLPLTHSLSHAVQFLSLSVSCLFL